MSTHPLIMLNASLGASLINFRGPLIRELVQRGYRVLATAPDIDEALSADLRALGAISAVVPIDRGGTSLVGDLRYAMALARLIRAHRPDFVLGYTIKPNIWGSIAARLAGVPSAAMVTGLGYAFIDGAGWKRRVTQGVARGLYRFALSGSRCVIFQNPDDVRDFVAARCLRDDAKARLVNGSGVDLLHFQPAPLPAQPVFLLIARLLHTKGLKEFVAAAAIARASLPAARFVIAGPLDPSPDGISADLVGQWGAAGIDYCGELADVRPALADASIYVLPSYREGTPRSVLEAMAMGRPIITTDAPGCRQTVEAGVSGLLVPVRDTPALADAMIALGKNPGLRARMGAASLDRAQRLYAVDAVNRALLDHLELPGPMAAAGR